ALRIAVTPQIRRLRRLFYCGEWISSHALHVVMLHAPDYLGFESAIEMARSYRDEVQRGLRMRSQANQLLEALGGRAVHPINVAVGGFYAAPSEADLRRLIPEFEWGLEAAVDTTRWVSTFNFPRLDCDLPLVALTHPDEYPMNEGTLACSDGPAFAIEQFEDAFTERQCDYSTALQAVRTSDRSAYVVGPAARLSLNAERLRPTARELLHEIDLTLPLRNPYEMILARCLEMTNAYEEALEILRGDLSCTPARVPYRPRSGRGVAATEAPRGVLYHRYEIDPAGRIATARIVPPTSQSQAAIEETLRVRAAQTATWSDAAIAGECEKLVRCYDPCISCATHELRVDVNRRDASPQTELHRVL
ncbi:MAG: nickel-dependent hydrogenase large subunit, partial [Planctomycetales bacterium]|nr:nickel-dependent hydrogenase large subunit [Planctomycetales bacterium]